MLLKKFNDKCCDEHSLALCYDCLLLHHNEEISVMIEALRETSCWCGENNRFWNAPEEEDWCKRCKILKIIDKK